jgi:hypothetical protein
MRSIHKRCNSANNIGRLSVDQGDNHLVRCWAGGFAALQTGEGSAGARGIVIVVAEGGIECFNQR